MAYQFYKNFFSFILLPLLSSSLMANDKLNPSCNILSYPINAKKIPLSTSQIMIVKALGGFKAKVVLCEKQRNEWRSVFTPAFRAVIGRNGVASVGRKKEGDLKTPAGFFPIGEAFGFHPLAVKMDYKYITAADKFIDDVNSKHYNQWVTGSTKAQSYENMLIPPYMYGAIVNYNMNPIIRGAGSAIFIHLWTTPYTSTSGCIALEKKSVLKILHWLDKKQYPHILVQ